MKIKFISLEYLVFENTNMTTDCLRAHKKLPNGLKSFGMISITNLNASFVVKQVMNLYGAKQLIRIRPNLDCPQHFSFINYVSKMNQQSTAEFEFDFEDLWQ